MYSVVTETFTSSLGAGNGVGVCAAAVETRNRTAIDNAIRLIISLLVSLTLLDWNSVHRLARRSSTRRDGYILESFRTASQMLCDSLPRSQVRVSSRRGCSRA